MIMPDADTEIKNLRKLLIDTEKEKNQLVGSLSVTMEALKNNYGIGSLEEADKSLKGITAKRDKLKTELDSKLASIKEKYIL